MPLYEVKCNTCGKRDEVFRRVAEIDDMPVCCGEKMERQLSAPQIQPEIQPYKSMATGDIIDSRTKHKRHLKERGLVEIGDQHEAHQKQLEQRKKEQEKKQAEALRREIAGRIDTIRR